MARNVINDSYTTKESFTIRNKDQSMTSDEYLYDISEKKRVCL